jgi:phage baseplate assembly protein gpV
VVETAARATLEKDAIRVTLPLNDAAPSSLRVAAWLLSAKDERTPETVAEVRAGAREANLTLRWMGGILVNEMDWYRIGYRVEVDGAESSHGILSVGAIATNLITLRLAYPAQIAQGHGVSARVIAMNPVTGKPLPGVKLTATLVDNETDPKKLKQDWHEAVTARNGEAILNFAPMGEPGDDLDLTVVGTLSGSAGALAHDEVTAEIDVLDRTSVHVEMDKPLHKPGEMVHLRALAFWDSGRAAAGEPVTLTINDPDNKKLAEAKLKTNRFGIVQYDWKTTEQTAVGDYEVSFDLDNASSGGTENQTVRIQRYELPEFSVAATPDRAFYLDGQTPQVKIHAGYLFGKPVAAGSVRIVRADDAEWNPKTGHYDEPAALEATATLDANGDATVSLKVADEFDELKGSSWERFRDVRYRAMVTDATTGRTEPRNFAVRLTKEPVHIYLSPIGTDERKGEYMLSTSYADGTPASCKVTLDWMDAKSHPTRAAAVATNRYGLAKVMLHYPVAAAEGDDTERPQIRITARDKEGRLSHFDDSLWVSSGGGIWISLDHSLLAPNQAIEGTIHGKPGEEVDLDVLSETSVLEHWQIRMSGAEQAFSIPVRPAFQGLITLRAYSMRVEMKRSTWYFGDRGATRVVLYPDDRSLHANVKGLAAAYAPGVPLSAQLDLRNAAGGPAAGVFGVSVFDTAVEQRAETELEANDRWFGQDWWWLYGSSVGDVTFDSLNKTNMTKPISSDLDLAAEAVLMNSEADTLEITANDSSTVRNEYEQQMEKDVKPLRDAILKANPDNLPATAEELKKFLADAKLDEGILLDPWNTPYKADLSEDGNDDVVSLISAGPDKQFGTADDFSELLVERNVFAVPGARLNDLLSKTAMAGQPLPATVDALKKLALDSRINLDSAAQHTLQHNGKPYIYSIVVLRHFYFVYVQRDMDSTVWRSNWIDFFGRTEEKLGAALQKWAAAGNAFPETEADARRAFAAAGIDFDSLRDPLGRPFALRTKRELSYARIDKVKAGTVVEGGTRKVTLTTEVIQIVRTDEKGGAQELEEVSRFSHMVSEQSGSDVNPVAVDSGLFRGNTGAIGGTVTDQTGAVIPGAKIDVESESGDAVASATAKDDGAYVVSDLAPGFYKVKVDANGFMSFYLTDVHVASSALTTVDVTLRVGTTSQTVTVSAEAVSVQTQSASVAHSVFVSGKRSIVNGPNGSATITEQSMTPRLRHVFDETAYWAPSLETNAAGHAALKFKLPDSLTTWKLHAVGSTVDGRITAVDRTFKTFLPFFVDLDTPQTLTVGDAIWLPVNLRNYTTHVVSLPVTVKAANWFTLTTPATTRATVAPNAATPVIVGLRAASAAAAGPLRITAANAHEGDAVEKTVKVHPDGEPKMISAQELLRGGAKNTVAFDLPADAISGSVHAELLLYPNLGANVYHAMKAVLERPYGCAEQTISAAYPSLLFLEMETAAKHESAAKEQAQAYLQLGYDRLLGYFNAAGGLTYWGGNDTTADAALTAYGIEFLSEAEPYVNVDRARIVSAMEWLLAQQDKDGAWKPRYGMYSARQTLYIAGALAYVLRSTDFSTVAAHELQDRVKQAVARAQEYASHSALALHDPYANALRLNLAAESGDAATVERLRTELNATAQHGRDGAYGEFDGFSPFYGWGEGGRFETTAMALAAFNAAGNDADKKLEDDALLYLLRHRDGYGVWLSGQATVRVLKALLPLAINQLQNASPGDFTLTVNGKPLSAEQAAAVKSDNQIVDAPRTIDLTAMIHAGANTLEFAGAGDAAFANAQLTAWFYVPWAQAAVGKTRITVPGKDFGLDFGYECDAAGAKVGRPIDCTVSARRFGSEGYGMMLAEVGLPPGADVDRASLGKLLDNWTIERYELEPDRIVFYLWSSAAEGEKFTFRFTPRYAIRAKAAPAQLTDYYNPDLNATLAPQSFAVSAATAP